MEIKEEHIKKNCKACHGRGWVGFAQGTNKKVTCKCVINSMRKEDSSGWPSLYEKGGNGAKSAGGENYQQQRLEQLKGLIQAELDQAELLKAEEERHPMVQRMQELRVQIEKEESHFKYQLTSASSCRMLAKSKSSEADGIRDRARALVREADELDREAARIHDEADQIEHEVATARAYSPQHGTMHQLKLAETEFNHDTKNLRKKAREAQARADKLQRRVDKIEANAKA
jgi:chromosome segregation ATPase